MKSKPTPHIFTKGLLVAAAVFSIAGTGVFASSALLGQQYPSLAFGQAELGITDTQTDTATTTTTTTDNATEGTTATTAGDTTTDATTTTGGGGSANQLAGIIASLQLAPDRLAPEWVTAGYWELESDMPVIGAGSEGTEPTISRFDAIVEMTRIDDGTALHTHTFSDFQQSDIQFTAENTTSINGTMTATLEEGPVENVPVFITLQNNLITIAVDPVTTESHFGPTPITGIILAPEHLQQISNELAPTAAEAGGGGTGTGTETETGQQPEDTATMTTDTIGNTTGQ
ncbi:MAG: hypothetical protein M3278_04635 [Thermoproteota archaeon]|nr:hypothetical protein [Thermoproteota archaeon]